MFVKVASIDEVAPGEMLAVQVGAEELLLARIDDEVFAVNNLCSHAEGWLDMGFLIPDEFEVQCPLHEGRFDLRTGKPTHEPCVIPIGSYKVEVRDADIYLEVPDGV